MITLTTRSANRLLFVTAAVLASVSLGAVAHAEEPRTIDATNIEGELRLPEVLFITARDSDRPLDFLKWALDESSAPAHFPPTGSLHVIPLEAQEAIVPDHVLALAHKWAQEAASAVASTTEPAMEVHR